MNVFSGFAVGSFKAFDLQQKVPLRPLTLLFGPNSAGKSSVVHALAYLHEAVASGNLDVRHPRIGGTAIDLGGFPNFVHRRNPTTRCSFALEFDGERLPRDLQSLLKKKVSLLRLAVTVGGAQVDTKLPGDDQVAAALPTAAAVVTELSIELNGAVGAQLTRRRDGSFRLEVLGRDWNLARGLDLAKRKQLEASELAEAWRYVDTRLHELRIEGAGLIPRTVSHPLDSADASSARRPPRFHDGLVALVRAILDAVGRMVSTNVGNLRYLGPLRSYPARRMYEPTSGDPDWYAGGAYAWDLVARDDDLRNALNVWLGRDALQTRYQLAVQTFAPLEEIRRPLMEQFADIEENSMTSASTQPPEEWELEADHDWRVDDVLLSVRQSASELLTSLALKDLRTGTLVSHRDVGIGISQVLPVLALAHAARGDLVAIEQPELHLHPALQSELADVFIESALTRGNTFLLETHSEHLMLRVLRRIREAKVSATRGSLRPEDVAVLFVEPTDRGTRVTEIPIREDGEFGAPWPQGFFAERMKELF